MKLQAKWMWSVVFCLSALAFANEADALRVDKVYKVLFVSNGFPAFGTELAEITNNLGEALPDNGSEVVIRSVQSISLMSSAQLAEYSFVLWHVDGGMLPLLDAIEAAKRIQAAALPVMIFESAGFPLSALFGLVTTPDGDSASGPGNKVEGDTQPNVNGNGLYHVVLRNLILFDVGNTYEPLLPPQAWGDDAFLGKTVFWVHQSKLTAYTRGLLQHYWYDENELDWVSDPDRVLALVNDKKRIVASGIRDTSGAALSGIAESLFK